MLVTLSLPPNAQPLVSPGQTVDEHDVLYTIGAPGQETIVTIAKDLGIKPEHIIKHLRISVGDTIKKGGLMAVRDTFWVHKEILSDYTGTITDINHHLGSITLLQQTAKPTPVRSLATGVVSKVFPHEIVLDIPEAISVDLIDATSDMGGTLWRIGETEQLLANEILQAVVLKKSITRTEVAKLDALQAAGIILPQGQLCHDTPCAHIEESTFHYLSRQHGKKIVVSKKDKRALVYR